MPPEKKPPRKTLQPDAQRSSGGAVNLEARISSELCAGEQIVEPSAAKPQAAEEAEDEDEALGSSVEDQYITVEELQKDLSRLLQEKTSSQEIIKWLQVRFLHCSTSGLQNPHSALLFRRPSMTTTRPLMTSWRS